MSVIAAAVTLSDFSYTFLTLLPERFSHQPFLITKTLNHLPVRTNITLYDYISNQDPIKEFFYRVRCASRTGKQGQKSYSVNPAEVFTVNNVI